MKGRGFTLIELLVVIAIIAILAAILFPVFARARDNARQTSCLSNQRQIVTAIMSYAQDFDEKLPNYWNNTSYWYTWMDPYIKNAGIWICPSYTDDGNTRITFSYGINWRYINNYGSPYTHNASSLGEITNPSETLLTGESRLNYAWIEYPGIEDFRWDPDRHSNGSNYSFCDGHAKWVSGSEIMGRPASYFWAVR